MCFCPRSLLGFSNKMFKKIIRENYISFCIICLPVVSCINYCDPIFCDASKQHTLCKYPNSTPATRCMNYERIIRTAEEKRDLLDKINSRRNKIALGHVRSYPTAEAMMKMEWSEELERSSQRWADQCVAQTNTEDVTDTCRDLENTAVGQNIATVYGDAPGLSPLSLVDVWYMELLNVNATNILRYTTSYQKGNPRYSYFTQLIWAQSTEVGCGGVKFKEHLESAGTNIYRTVNRLVCNFAPSGNIIGEPVYTPGPPCSRCPLDSVCDSEYMALCNRTYNRINSKSHKLGSIEIETVTITDVSTKPAVDIETTTDNVNNTFDYLSHFFYFTKQPPTVISTESSIVCKDALDVDLFLELLKKKLSNDPMFKELLLSTKGLQTEYNLSDPNVAMFVSKIYSKKEPPTTTKLQEPDYVNSTLLVDLVEAVIFRSGERNLVTEKSEEAAPSVMDISPIKIQAELAEVKLNQDFTGHYFFPEETTDESVTETSYAYDDAASIPVSDVVLEIESLKRDKTTKDFIEDIIEADFMTESTVNREKRNHVYINENDLDSTLRIMKNSIENVPTQENYGKGYVVVQYYDLLKKLAKDLKVLKLNERFFCCKNKSIERHFIQRNLIVILLMIPMLQ